MPSNPWPMSGCRSFYDPDTGRLKVTAEVSAIDSPAVDPPGVKVNGFVSGHVLRDPSGPRGAGGPLLLFANSCVPLGIEPGSPPAYAPMGHLLFDSVDAFQQSFGPHAPEIVGDIPNYTNTPSPRSKSAT